MANPALQSSPLDYRTPGPSTDLTGKAGSGTGDAVLRTLSTGAAVCVLIMLGSLVAILTYAAVPSIKAFGAHFLVNSTWRPNSIEVYKRDAKGHLLDEEGKITHDQSEAVVDHTIPPTFGAAPVIYGTVMSSGISLLFAIPLSLGAALFLVRIAPRIRAQIPARDGSIRVVQVLAPVSFLIEFLAAIPSLAYGIWGVFVLAPFLQNHLEPFLRLVFGHVPGIRSLFYDSGGLVTLTGKDMLCGGMILAVMIVPIITAVSRDVLRAVPIAQIEGTQALGATWWQSSWEMLRYSKSGLFGAIMLGLARAAGETMAIAMVIGNSNQIHASPFFAAQTMSSLLAQEYNDASGLQLSALTEVALVLLVMSLVFNIVARALVVGKQARR